MKIVDMDALWKGIEELIGNIDVYLPVNFINEFAENYIVDVVPKWIPCEERLPEPNVAVLGYAPAFHNIFTVCYDSVCGWMTWCPACYEPFPSWQGEIVAWMPLPEPYEGERRDDE